MKQLIFFLFTIFNVQMLFAQTDSLPAISDTINQRIFLIGDAGDMNSATHPVIE